MNTAVNSDFATRLLTSPDQLLSIAPEWIDLWKKCPEATTFQRPEWLLPWIEAFQPQEPAVVEVRYQGRLIGLAPLLIYSKGTERVLAFMGGGVSDYLDVLIDPEYTDQTIAFLFAADLISKGQVVVDNKGAWTKHRASTDEENEFIRRRGFAEYAKWHLGVDLRFPENSKRRYKFPYGDFKNVHRCGLLAAKARARQYRYADIENAAAELEQAIKKRTD